MAAGQWCKLKFGLQWVNPYHVIITADKSRAMTAPLLMTKLYIPSPGKYLVRRERLVEKLDQCLEPGCRLTLISAPAGFGKTTLAAAWIAAAKPSAASRQAAWLSIDDGDNDPVIFWSYVIAALQTQQAGVGQQALNALAAQGGELERKLAFLINDLAQISHPCVLVLDDYHLIRNPSIHQSLAFFIEHAPPHIHLLIASRTDPPLPLALLRGRGSLLEIRLNDLRFSDEDADAYLNAGIGLNLAAQSVEALNQKTEGWIAGLQMATLAMQDVSLRDASAVPGQKKAADFVDSFSGSNRFILDYLIEEVLNRQPEPIQQFLVQTSILDRLCGPLCDALLQGSGADAKAQGAQPALEYLESCNLFLFPLDQQRYWYRYHQLFADLLRKRLTQSAPEMVQELHRRAIQWYEQNGLIASAIHHAFQLPDYRKAAALVAQVTEAMWGRGEHATLLAWMDALPDAEKKLYPALLTFQVSMLISAGKLKEAEACVAILEQYIQAALETSDGLEAQSENSALTGSISELRTYIASFYGDRPALFGHARTALQHLNREQDVGKRCGISLVLGSAYLAEGNLQAAAQALEEAIASGEKARKPHMVLTGISNLAIVLWFQGSMSRAARVCQEGQEMVEQYGFDRSTMAADIWLARGALLCERGAIQEAEPYICRGLELAQEQQYMWQAAWGYQVKAHLLLAQGRLAEAETAAQSAEQWAESHPVPAHISRPGRGLLADIWLRQGKIAQAEQYLQAHQITADGVVGFPHQAEYLALARLARLRGNDGSAALLLERICEWAEAHKQMGSLVSALLLQALMFPPRGSGGQAGSFLDRALALAQAEGFTQIFVNEGEPAAALLREAVRQNIHPEYASRLLAAFADNLSPAVETRQLAAAPGQARPISSEIIPLVEPLSRREMETLQLMAEGYSNKEIAQRLYISLRTVKYYSTGLYNKLGVDSRMQAVNRARELGLL
jgi:LuxR family transcriptional regulator, maltose regulon positive regulatory protein